MRYKRASLEIGINTIVILVIAMMLLGLGIGFVKNIFGQINPIVTKIKPPSLQTPPSASTPLIMDVQKFSVQAGKNYAMDLGVYNAGTIPKTFSVSSHDCEVPPTATVTTQAPQIRVLPQVINPGEAGYYTIFIIAQYGSGNSLKNMETGDFICNLEVRSYNDVSLAKSDTAGTGGTSVTSLQYTMTVTS